MIASVKYKYLLTITYVIEIYNCYCNLILVESSQHIQELVDAVFTYNHITIMSFKVVSWF